MRRADWPVQLHGAIEAARHRPFAWGQTDCCLFVADAVLAMTGRDPAVEFRGRYRTRRGAYAALKRIAGGGVEAVARRAFGDPLPAAGLGGRGDVALVGQGADAALGIITGEKIAVTTPEGLAFLSRSAARIAWRI